jgi:hypothetical protein
MSMYKTGANPTTAELKDASLALWLAGVFPK